MKRDKHENGSVNITGCWLIYSNVSEDELPLFSLSSHLKLFIQTQSALSGLNLNGANKRRVKTDSTGGHSGSLQYTAGRRLEKITHGWHRTKSDRRRKIPYFNQPLITITEEFYVHKWCPCLHKKKQRGTLITDRIRQITRCTASYAFNMIGSKVVALAFTHSLSWSWNTTVCLNRINQAVTKQSLWALNKPRWGIGRPFPPVGQRWQWASLLQKAAGKQTMRLHTGARDDY